MLNQMLDILGEAPTANGWFAGKKGALKGEPADITLDLKTLRKDIMSVVATGGGRTASRCRCRRAFWRRCRPRSPTAGATSDIGDLAKFFREHMGQKF